MIAGPGDILLKTHDVRVEAGELQVAASWDTERQT